ncbi:FBP domain-containing protein [Pseudarthrobacter sp. J75]|uniref:FBP domain-containing protein n=1 Tax=unclassified Pseudarthrobacter TaxID=2647000 RepID=UPI002E8240B2|nr:MULTISPECIES: FBP domain-containing protein [unclassified Pseudarthrobacter]MEE2524617.1 FBP domain-containing protein [Pseudarthrobacter sp. J47]MEE2530705.1 FBP domain-containing protein [Pseudarthrobacter sp. J75]MEE2570427.1 FBP domain-containing protein [Pseudarthrobacter sp. J64]
MQKISPQQIRSSFVNASRSEAAKLNLPQDFDSLDWENLDFLGWRDPKMPLRGYLVLPAEDGGKPTGVLLRAPEGGARKNRSVLCELCRDVFSKEDVLLWVAKRAGQSGRDGNTVGTLICADFLCSGNVRVEPPASEINPDPAEVVQRQVEGLRARSRRFMDRVQGR